jgi:translocation and assembly module TamB
MDEQVQEPRRRWSLRRRIAAGLLLLALVALAILWTQREPIAAGFIDRELGRRGVPASYEVARIGLHTQRLRNLVIGDPADPDLTAELVEVELGYSLAGPTVETITARGVRLNGRLVDGKVSFGAIDKLLPPPTGKPFALPDQVVDVEDVTVRLDTPWGRIGFALRGQGNLSDGFRGRVAAASSQLAFPGCTVARPRANVAVSVTDRRPSVEGPVSAARLLCPKAELDLMQPQALVDASFAESLDSWIGEAEGRTRLARFGENRAAGVSGTIGFSGTAEQTEGSVEVAVADGRIAGFLTDRVTLDARYAASLDSGRISLRGDLAARGASVPAIYLAPVTEALAAAQGTPVGPIGAALAEAVRRAASGFDAQAEIRLVTGFGSDAVRIERLRATNRSGARLALQGGDGFTYYAGPGLVRMNGELGLSGGGFPAVRLSLTQPSGDAPLSGIARIAPMQVGNARLVLAPVRFGAGPGGGTRFETIALVDGPLSDGRVLDLMLPLRGRIGPGGFAINDDCVTASFSLIEVAGLRLERTRLPLCPTGRAMLWSDGSGISGGVQIRAPRLQGTLGSSPISLAASRLAVDFADPGFTGSDVAIRLGREDFLNRLDLASLSGRFTDEGVAGRFAGAAGQIGTVPLLISDGSGRWSLLGGDLSVDGSLTVSDQTDPPRFYPLVTNDFRLRLDDGIIDATGTLTDPETGTRVTDVTIAHNLSTGRGDAVLDVPGIAFTEEYQPEELSRLTTGVVALVRGTVTGRGRIAWSPEGTTSTGTFSTADMDLAAPFGPVNGLTTTIEFTDLLNLVSAPGQTATVELVQTGIDVVDGTIRYQLLPDLKVRVESGRWPFAGGELVLEETVLDFAQESAKRLTFRVIGMEAANFVQQMEFSNISATGTFDGVIPMVFDQAGGRIVGGHLEARPGGGTLSYIGEVSEANLGAYGKLAFDALKSLRYDKFTMTLDGSLDGEFVSRIELDGIARNTGPQPGIVGAVIGQLAKIPFEFNIAIRGPFRALLATARSFEDPSLFIQQILPEEVRDLIETVPVETDRNESEAVQTEESEPVQ